MVHALRETWRVLATGATLLDLRPLSTTCPIEVVTPAGETRVGEVDATGYASDDAAADRAVRRLVDDEWFRSRGETRFEFDFYWDTVAEMRGFMETSERMTRVSPSYADLQGTLRKLRAAEGGRGRLRCRRPTMLAVYHTAGAPRCDRHERRIEPST